jgi:hypothetical protein
MKQAGGMEVQIRAKRQLLGHSSKSQNGTRFQGTVVD